MIKLYKIYLTNDNIEKTPHLLEITDYPYIFFNIERIVEFLLNHIDKEIHQNFKFINYNVVVKQYNYAVEIHISKDLLFIITESGRVSIDTIYKQLGWKI